MSSILYHGPGARQEALNEAARNGRLVAPPIGDDGLKIAEVRSVVELMMSTPVGMSLGSVVIGPMDNITSVKASDGLLKMVEEPSEMVLPILWAHDLGGVSPTIRSRCLPRWAPFVDTGEDLDAEIGADGSDLAYAVLEDRLWEIPPLVKKYDIKDKKRLPELLGFIAQGLLVDGSAKAVQVWEGFRPVTLHRNPTSIEVISALLGAT